MEIERLYHRPAEELLDQAWALRRAHFPPALKLAAPGAKRYQIEGFRNHPHRFAAISLTGRACALRCEHCQGQLLESMYPASTGQALRDLADELVAKGCQGVLLSGGADHQGQVPLDGHLEAIACLKALGLTVIVHTGLVDEGTARDLKTAGVDQVLVDVIGDEETIRQVYHLDKKPDDYAATLAVLKEVGLDIAPHVVIGLHFGQIRGELAALEMITNAEPEAIILVVLNPLPGTPMARFPAPSAEIVGRLAAVARVLNPERRISLGCARPAGPMKAERERLAIAGGINALAYPTQAALRYARSRSLALEWREACCSLL
ncbi:MAG: radical SAM protein [Chloroflexota bacterium]|nr:radical SAM protein [Chloroflexota bacterium]